MTRTARSLPEDAPGGLGADAAAPAGVGVEGGCDVSTSDVLFGVIAARLADLPLGASAGVAVRRLVAMEAIDVRVPGEAGDGPLSRA